MSGYKRVNFYELCRLCATNQQKDKTHIFHEEGRKIQLQNKIQSCLSLTVCENDFLPKVVCSKCLRSLEVCYIFRQECVSSESMLSSYFKNFRYTEDFKKSGKVYIKDTTPKNQNQETDLNQQQTTEKPNCHLNNNNQTIDNPSYYSVQLPTTQTIIKNEPKIIQNNNSNQISYNLNTINLNTINKQQSQQQQVKNELNNVVVNANGEVINIATQLIDLETIINQANLQKKLQKLQQQQQQQKRKELTNEQQIIKIDLTSNDDNFDTGQKLIKQEQERQQQQQHKINNPTVIFNNFNEFNNQNYNNTNNLYTTTTTTTSNQINLTNATTTTNLENQSTVNLNVLNQDLQQNQFNNNTNNNNKIANNNNNNNNKKITNLENNVKVHICEVCQKSFKRREHLYQHVKLHTGFRPYMCDNCNKSFMRKEHLLRHMTSHSGQKNFTCNICDKSFSRNDNLLKHKKTHNKQTSYTCDICQKHFVMKHYYLAHKLTHDTSNNDLRNLNNVWNVLKT